MAFAGDVHFEGFLPGRPSPVAWPGGSLPRPSMLDAADLTVVNLETAVTTRGHPGAKEYKFRAPPTAFTALRPRGWTW